MPERLRQTDKITALVILATFMPVRGGSILFPRAEWHGVDSLRVRPERLTSGSCNLDYACQALARTC